MNYVDPLEAIWMHALHRLGWTLRRDDEVFASWDGKGTLTICTPAGFDPDDTLAQMVLHEICHCICQGPDNFDKPDFGLENIDYRDLQQEYTCHRLQAALTDPHGLRDMLQPATEHLPHYLALPEDPLDHLSQIAWEQSRTEPWRSVLDEALSATSELARVVAPLAPGTLWDRWIDRRLGPEDCRPCGACCHRGFHRVEVADDEDVPRTVVDDFGRHLPRPNGDCVHLGQPDNACAIYAGRPRSCSDLVIGGSACREARRRANVDR